MSDNASPRPWEIVGKDNQIVSADGKVVVPNTGYRENAELIVEAVNCHDWLKDRTTIPYISGREIPAIKTALSAWRKLRRDKVDVLNAHDRAWIIADPAYTAEQCHEELAWYLELLSQIEERIRKESAND